MELFELIQTLNRAHGPSGDEGEIREVIRALAEPYADEITADTMGPFPRLWTIRLPMVSAVISSA